MPIDATTQTDYLYGYSADSDNRLTYVNTEQPKANIYFKHAMARVTMRIKKSADNEKTYKFPYINLLNVDKSAYVNVLEDGAILDASGTSNLTAKPSDYALENSDNEIVADFLVIPGNTEGKKIMLNMSDNISSFENGLSAAVPVTNWEAGQQYTYMVTIKNHYSLSITEADITPWDSINQEEMTADRTATSVGGTVGEAVDLGLSVKWASWNVGASTPEETGGLYGWADPTGAKWSRSNDDFPNANPPSDIQNTDYDIAHVQWGKEWFIPSDTERKELVEKCKWTRTTLNGVDGYKVSSTTNGNSIFLPCTGYRDGSPWFYSPSTAGKGCYWTSTGSSSYTDGIFSVHILCWEDNSNINYTSNAVTSARRYGYAVRPVTIQ